MPGRQNSHMSIIKQNIHAMLISMVTTIVVSRPEKLLQHEKIKMQT